MEEQCQAHLIDLSQRAQERKELETEGQWERRLQSMREWNCQEQAASSQSGAVPPLSEDQVRQQALARDLEKFQKKIHDHPCNICYCCDRITYQRRIQT